MRGLGLPSCAFGVSVPTSTKPKPSGEKRRPNARVLVEAGGHAERIAKFEAPQLLRKPRIVRRGLREDKVQARGF